MARGDATSPTLLEVEDLAVSFVTDEGTLPAVDGVSFRIAEGETLGVVGESGCGKSVSSLAILRLLPMPPARVVRGSVKLRGKELLTLSDREMRAVRGDDIAMIFQEPMTSLNPVYSVGWQIVEAIRLHRKDSRGAARARAIELLRLVGIPSPERTVDAYPHQLSGGMRQRAMIAMALACEPALLIADEPTTALDVTIQAQILELLRRLQGELGMSVLLITHDLGVVAEYADDVVVMYAGKIVEAASTRELFAGPKHPYTRGLIGSLPRLGAKRGTRLPTIEGLVPDLRHLPPGCRFQDRCSLAQAACREGEPPLVGVGGGSDHRSACLRAEEL